MRVNHPWTGYKSTMSSPVVSQVALETATLGPLTPESRVSIMRHVRGMDAVTRRTFRRLLILAQARGLTPDLIARTAAQAREHADS